MSEVYFGKQTFAQLRTGFSVTNHVQFNIPQNINLDPEH